ncbi:MAG: hypothetical protein IJS60_09945 [Abditibacteriota bacterium]|nr:hypothetical protein [Abditibacteriota bacterium]
MNRFLWTRIILTVILLSLFVFSYSDSIYYEDFENYPNIILSSDSQYLQSNSSAKVGDKCLFFEDGKSEKYFIRTDALSVNKNYVKVSFWLKLGQVDLYNFNINIKDPITQKNFMSIMEGYTGSDNTVWGSYRFVDPDGNWINLCKALPEWTFIEIDLDFDNNICDFYVNKDHILTDLPLNHKLKYRGEFIFEIAGHSSKGQKGWYLDDLRIGENKISVKEESAQSIKSIELKNKKITLKLNENTGQIFSLSFMGRLLCASSKDYYKFENRDKSYWAKEIYDKVKNVDMSSNKIVLSCENDTLKDIEIHKIYEIQEDNTITKEVEFINNGEEGFITYKANIDYDENFLKESFPEGFMLGIDNKGEESASLAKGYRINNKNTYGIGILRDRVNGKFVMPSSCDPSMSSMSSKVFSDYLTDKASGRIRLVPIEGDFIDFTKYVNSRKELLEVFNVKRPKWLDSLVCDIMYLTGNVEYEKQAAPLYTTSTIWFLNPPWGNWASESDPPKSSHPNVKGIIPDIRSQAPYTQISSYTNTQFDINSDIYKLNDPDFFVIDREGNYTDGGVPSDSEGAKTFMLQILNPKVKEYWMNMHADKLKGWNENFFYMDGPGAYEELLDYKQSRVIQNYDWLDFYKELREVIDNNTEEGIFFTNGRQPFSNIGYIEWRDREWKALATKDKWKYIAKQMLETKAGEIKGYIFCPTYGTDGAQPTINTYCICFGWLGHLNNIKFMPWHIAALEYRDVELIPKGIKNPWWHKDNPSYEAYAFRKGENIIINAVNHSDGGECTLNLDLKELGLSKGSDYYVLCQKMNDPMGGSERAFDFISFKKIKITDTIKVPLNDIGCLTTVIISPIGAVVLNTGAKVCQTGINTNYGVNIIKKGKEIVIETKYDNVEVFIPFVKKVNTELACEPYDYKGIGGVKITIPQKGEYKIMQNVNKL